MEQEINDITPKNLFKLPWLSKSSINKKISYRRNLKSHSISKSSHKYNSTIREPKNSSHVNENFLYSKISIASRNLKNYPISYKSNSQTTNYTNSPIKSKMQNSSFIYKQRKSCNNTPVLNKTQNNKMQRNLFINIGTVFENKKSLSSYQKYSSYGYKLQAFCNAYKKEPKTRNESDKRLLLEVISQYFPDYSVRKLNILLSLLEIQEISHNSISIFDEIR